MKPYLSPAKINLFLRVLRKRPDGYHDLASLFQTISLADTLYVSVDAKKDELTCTDRYIPTDGSNLVQKAAILFREKTGLSFYFKIHIEKKIPSRSGLGGGSSNAATVLFALNELLEAKIPASTLQQWSSSIGSDVPFFFSLGSAYCQGRGENVQNVENLPPQDLWIVKPSYGLSTPKIFKDLKIDELPGQNPEEMLAGFFTSKPVYHNDLEIPAFKKKRALFDLKERLRQSQGQVSMTGSGSAFFCVGGKAPLVKASEKLFKERFIDRLPDRWYSL